MISPARTSRWELPPRARRIPSTDVLGRVRDGTTSACAENTADDHTGIIAPGNYLRVRGEYRRRGHQKAEEAELPPRARRIRGCVGQGLAFGGTTSACAENTMVFVHYRGRIRNYLRVRGEYLGPMIEGGRGKELPPRARRIPFFHFNCATAIGTTSACAENTDPAPYAAY